MSYDAIETSTELGKPIELYTFTIGSTVYRYTSAEDEITFAAMLYLPRQIDRSAPTQKDSDHRSDMDIVLPTDDPVCARFIGVVPGEHMYVSVVRFHRGDTQAYNQWTGKVASPSYTKAGAVCTLRCLTIETAVDKTIPVYRYQSLCNHRLFDERCKVLPASHKYTGLVLDITGRTITISGLLAAKGADWAVGGYIAFGVLDYRVVLGQAGDVLTLLLPFYEDVLAQDVDVYAGCSHKRSTCVSKFNNLLNFGGFADVPKPNPFEERMA